MLKAAATALPEVWARRCHAIRRRDEDLVDRRSSETAARLDQTNAQLVARKPAAHENHVAVCASDAFAAEREVLDRDIERVAATRFRHGPSHYKRRSETSQFDEDFAVYHTDQ